MQDRVIVITGATGGIGQAITPILAAQGAKLVLAARRADPLTQLAQAGAPDQIVTIPTDVTQFSQVEALVDQARQRFGRIDVLINAAGLGILKMAPQLSTSDLDRMLDVNLKGSFYSSQLIGNVMREQKSGHILNFPGILGKHPMAMAAGYCASKFGVVGFSKCMADELKSFGVRFTLFYFGGVDTPFWDTVGMKVKREKMLSPQTVSEAILFALNAPVGAVPSEVVLQPDSHQFL